MQSLFYCINRDPIKRGNIIEDHTKTLIMKKFFSAVLFISFISCNSNSNETTSTTDSSATEIGGVENVNGNVPDTTSGGATPNSGDNTTRVDSTYADTTKKE